MGKKGTNVSVESLNLASEILFTSMDVSEDGFMSAMRKLNGDDGDICAFQLIMAAIEVGHSMYRSLVDMVNAVGVDRFDDGVDEVASMFVEGFVSSFAIVAMALYAEHVTGVPAGSVDEKLDEIMDSLGSCGDAMEIDELVSMAKKNVGESVARADSGADVDELMRVFSEKFGKTRGEENDG